jgi:uncharacterized membrane protein (DUF485 family)
MIERPPRVRITHPRTDAARRGPHRPVVREIDEQTRLGDVYMSSLIRSQRRLALLSCTAVTVLLVGTALVAAYSSSFVDTRILGLPLAWLVLGLAVYPALIALGWWTAHIAERNERAFLDLLRRR